MPLDDHVDVKPRCAHSCDELVEPVETRLRASRLETVLHAEHADEPAHFRERLARRPLDRRERLVSRGAGCLVQAFRTGLEDDDAQRVGDDVVQFARDSRALLGDGEPRALLAFLFELRCQPVSGVHDPSDEPEASEDRGHEDEIVAGEPGPDVDGDHQSRAARDRTPAPGVRGDRVRRDHPGEERRVGRAAARLDGDLEQDGPGDCERDEERRAASPSDGHGHAQRREREHGLRADEVVVGRPDVDLGEERQRAGERDVAPPRRGCS